MEDKRIPPLNWLRTFEATARNLSFTVAAQELHITQSAVSQQIKSLETYLGQPLFIRRARSLSLTDSARGLLPNVQAAFEMLGESTDAFRGYDSETTLDIHSNLAFTALWLTPRLGDFIAQNPWVKLNISTSVWTTEHTRPYASVEIRFGSGRWDGVTGEKLLSPAAYPVCAPELGNEFAGAKDVLEHPLLDVAGARDNWERWLRAAGVGLPKEFMPHQASTFVVTLALAKSGFGIALAHDLLVREDLKSGALVRPLSIEMPMSESYYLITPSPNRMNPAAIEFLKWLEKNVSTI